MTVRHCDTNSDIQPVDLIVRRRPTGNKQRVETCIRVNTKYILRQFRKVPFFIISLSVCLVAFFKKLPIMRRERIYKIGTDYLMIRKVGMVFHYCKHLSASRSEIGWLYWGFQVRTFAYKSFHTIFDLEKVQMLVYGGR